MRLRPLHQLVLLVLCIGAVEYGLYLYYANAAQGHLAEPIREHTAMLESGTIPPAHEINLEADSWVRVAHFESSFYQTLFLIDTVMMLLIAWVLLRGRISLAIASWAHKNARSVHLVRALYLLAYSVLFAFIGIPLQISGYLIGSLRGTGVPTPDVLAAGFLQDLVIAGIFALLTFVPFYWIMDRFKRSWWALGALFMSVFSIFTAFVSPVVLDPLYLDLDPIPDSALTERIETLASVAGVPIEDVYLSDTDNSTLESNAFVTGLGASKRIILDDTMLRFYSEDEIIATVGHELGHYVLGHLWYGMIALAVATFVSLYMISLALRYVVRTYGNAFGVTGVSDITLYPLVAVLLSMTSLLTSPATSYVNRTLERAADAYELQLVKNPRASADTLKKMTYQSFIDPDPSPLMQAWFGTHPSMRERIEFFETAER